MADVVVDYHSGGKTLDFLPFCMLLIDFRMTHHLIHGAPHHK